MDSMCSHQFRIIGGSHHLRLQGHPQLPWRIPTGDLQRNLAFGAHVLEGRNDLNWGENKGENNGVETE